MTTDDRFAIQREVHRQAFEPPDVQPKTTERSRVEAWQDGRYVVATGGQIQLKSARTTGVIGTGAIVNRGYSIDSMPASRVQPTQKPQLIGAKKRSVFVLGQSWQITEAGFLVDGSGIEGEVSYTGTGDPFEVSIGSATRTFSSLIAPILSEASIPPQKVAIIYTGGNLYAPIGAAYSSEVVVDVYPVSTPSSLEAVPLENYNHVWDFAAMSTTAWQGRIEALNKKGAFIYQTLWGFLIGNGSLGGWTGGLDRDAKVLATIANLYQESLSQTSNDAKCRGEIANRFGGGTFLSLYIGSFLGNFTKGKPICTVLRKAATPPIFAIVDQSPPNTPFLMYK